MGNCYCLIGRFYQCHYAGYYVEWYQRADKPDLLLLNQGYLLCVRLLLAVLCLVQLHEKGPKSTISQTSHAPTCLILYPYDLLPDHGHYWLLIVDKVDWYPRLASNLRHILLHFRCSVPCPAEIEWANCHDHSQKGHHSYLLLSEEESQVQWFVVYYSKFR